MIAPEVKRILKELKPFKKNLVVIAIAGVILALCQSALAAIVKNLGDSLQSKNFDHLINVGAAIIALSLISGICRYFHIYLMNYTGELVVQNMRHSLQKKFMRLSMTFHNTFASGSGGLMSRILNDLVIIQNGLRMFADFFREPLVLIFLIGYLFYLDWKLTLIIFLVLPMILWFLRQVSRTIKTHSIKGQEDLEVITGTIKESLDGVRIIQSFNLEDEMSNRFQRESKGYLDSRKKIHQRVEMSSPVSEFVVTCTVVGITLYMGYEISESRATFGDFMGYIAALLGLSAPVKKLQESYVRIQETIVASRRAFSIIDDEREVPQLESHKAFPTNWQTITYKDVSFSYGKEMILKNLNLTIKRGEMIAFVGASGSGKSTIVNLLERFFDPTSGQILIDDTPIDQINLKDLRKNVALVTQDVFLFSDTIERNIWAGDFSKSKEQIESAAKVANAHNFIMKNPGGYSNRVGDRGGLLSGGEKQRVSIARALYKDAPILILDEATSALDSASEIEVQKGLDLLMQGRTALVIAHRLSTVAKADRIIVMRAGEIVEVGTHQSLLEARGEYHNLYELQRT